MRISKSLSWIVLLSLVLVSSYALQSFSNQNSDTWKTNLYNQSINHKMPETLSFCGEDVHFKNELAYKNYFSELKKRTRKNRWTQKSLDKSALWFPEIETILNSYGLPKDLKYLAMVESNFKIEDVSHKGAAGFWQFTPLTAKGCGLIINDEVDERLNPYKSTHAAAKHLKKLYGYFGNWASSAAAYNCGELTLFIAFNKQKVNSYYDLNLNKETARYVYAMVAVKDLVENPKKYGFKKSNYKMAKTKPVKVDKSISDLRMWCKNHKVNYNKIKEINPWILGNKLTIEGKVKAYYIRIPA